MSEKTRFLLGYGFLFILFLLESWAFNLDVRFTPFMFMGYIIGWLMSRG
jgi:hypothetical protein